MYVARFVIQPIYKKVFFKAIASLCFKFTVADGEFMLFQMFNH